MTDDALRSTPLRGGAADGTGHYGAGYGDPTRHWGDPLPEHWTAHEDDHYRRLRAEHERQLDDEYHAWRRERFSRDFEDWRTGRRGGRQAAESNDDSVLESLGRAVSSTVTGSFTPGASDGGAVVDTAVDQRERTDRFFERS